MGARGSAKYRESLVAVVMVSVMDAGDGATYMLVTIGGVQRFIQTGRTTADVWAGSRIMAVLSDLVTTHLESAGATVILPASAGSTRPPTNRAWAHVPARLAANAPDLIHEIRRAIATGLPFALPDGFPDLSWVMVEGAYADAYRDAQAGMVARRRAAVFPPYAPANVPRAPSRPVCSSCARREVGDVTDGHRRRGETLCNLCAHRRIYRYGDDSIGSFPSTSTMASLPSRIRILEEAVKSRALAEAARVAGDAIADLHEKLDVRGDQTVASLAKLGQKAGLTRFAAAEGSALYLDDLSPRSIERDYALDKVGPEEALAALPAARTSVAALWKQAAKAGIHQPSSYLAIVAQDVDHLGRAFGDNPWHGAGSIPDLDLPAHHRDLSEKVAKLARALENVVDRHQARVVYSGGDDLFAFTSVDHALAVADAARRSVSQPEHLAGLTASTAVVYFHRSFFLQSAVERARRALHEAKRAGRDRLAVVVLRRGGERASTTLPWRCSTSTSAATDVAAIANAFGQGASRGVVGSVEPLTTVGDTLDSADRLAIARRALQRHGFDKPATTVALDLLASSTNTADWTDTLQAASFISAESRAR